MISSLTDGQLKDLSQRKKKVLGRFLTGSGVDAVRASAALLGVYRALDENLNPRVLFAQGPKQGIDMVEHLLGVRPVSTELPELGLPSGVFAQAKNLSDRMFGHHIDIAHGLKERFNSCCSSETAQSLRNMVLYDLNFQIVSQLITPIFKHLDTLITDGVQARRCRPALYPSWYDADWTSFYFLCDQVLDTGIESHWNTREFADAGGFMVYTYDSFAVIVGAPDLIHRDLKGRLHHEDGPAVAWKDGTKIYFWHGIEVPKRLIEQPDLISKQEVLGEKNAEVRRCFLEILGSERFGQLLGLELLDERKDPYGNALKLFRTAERDKLAGDHIYFGAVVCPSTMRRYFLCVPPFIKTADEAVAWTFGKTTDDYHPQIET